MTFKVEPTLNGYKPEQATSYYRQLYERLRALPGVHGGWHAMMAVMEGDEWDSSVTVESYHARSRLSGPDPHMKFVSPGYFKTMEVPMLQGRDFRLERCARTRRRCA